MRVWGVNVADGVSVRDVSFTSHRYPMYVDVIHVTTHRPVFPDHRPVFPDHCPVNFGHCPVKFSHRPVIFGHIPVNFVARLCQNATVTRILRKSVHATKKGVQ